jgi:hypothetical protein
MSWLIVGIHNLRYKTGLSPQLHSKRACAHSLPHESLVQKNQTAPSASHAEGRLADAEDRDAASRSCSKTDFSQSAAAFELPSSRRRAKPHEPESQKLSMVYSGFDLPFRLAKLTACRKVRRIYRRYQAKSRQYERESAVAQAQL